MGYRSYIREKLERTSLEMEPEEWKTLQLKASIPLTIAFASSVWFITLNPVLTLATSVVALGLIFGATIFVLDYLAYLKAQEVEEMLPEALELLASNLKAGMPIRDALRALMDEEFGQLGKEMSIALTEVSTGSSITDALEKTTKNVDSELYRKTIETLSRSIESGVNLPTICSELARNINDMENIRRQIKASTVTYTMFLGFAAFIAAPVLFALSTFLVEASSEIFMASEAATGGQAAGGPAALLSFSTTLPPVDLLTNFFLVAIGITAFFASLGIGIVREGSMKVGLKYVPAFLTLSYLVFFVARHLIDSFVGLSI